MEAVPVALQQTNCQLPTTNYKLMKILENIPLAPLTTLGVGGLARYFAEIHTPEDAAEAVAWTKSHALPLFVLGGGSNLVVADAGFPGLVLKMAVTGVSKRQEGSRTFFTAGAGEDWDTFVAQTVDSECAGLECLSGIPGTVGATPVQNVGAYGQEVSECIQQVEALDLKTGLIRTFENIKCGFSYRSSRFNTIHCGAYIILMVTFTLDAAGQPRISYADLKRVFGERQPTLAEVRKAVCEIRQRKGMLLVDGDTDCRSAGSFFKNPVLSATDYALMQERATRMGLAIPSYPALASRHKVPAAWLVENAGFHKGHRRGPVAISSKHALAITNLGGASAADVLALKQEIQDGVYRTFGIHLQPEPVFVGFPDRDIQASVSSVSAHGTGAQS
jgi:UDP-N-acetylmuramate dehydrogenase